MVAEVATLTTEGVSANRCAFDRSGAILGVACDDTNVKLFATDSGEFLADLQVRPDRLPARDHQPKVAAFRSPKLSIPDPLPSYGVRDIGGGC